jgi:hypothetical protein
MLFYLPVILMIVGTTTYHIAQKSVPTQVNPVFSLVINYFTALVGTLLLIPLYPSRSAGSWNMKGINWGERGGGRVDCGRGTRSSAGLSERVAREFAVGDWQ